MVKTRRRVNKRKTQRLWKMHGCSRRRNCKGGYGCQKGGCGCGLQTGGNKCGLQKGGYMQLSPSPFLNKPWTPPIQSWPGVQGSGTGNWLTKNNFDVDVSDRTAIQERAGQIFPLRMGGKRKGTKRRKMTKRIKNNKKSKRGGTGLGQLFGYGVNSAYSNLVGSPNMPVNPSPTTQFIQQ